MESRKLNTERLAICKLGTAPSDNEHIALVTNRGSNMTRQAVVRRNLKRSRKKAIDTSAIDTVDVTVAINSSKKNNMAQSCEPLICVNIPGRVTNTRVVPDRPSGLSPRPKLATAGNMISPISTATRKSHTDTVTAVRVIIVDFGK